MGVVRITPGGLTDFPAQARLGQAEEALNVDPSDGGARTRRGVLPYNGNLTEGPGGGIQGWPTLFAHFRDGMGAVHELRGNVPGSGNATVQAYHGLGGPTSGAVLGAFTVGTGHRPDARWSWTEFNGQMIVATDPQPTQQGRTLLRFDPIGGWSRPAAKDRTVTPYHGSEFFYGLDGDDEGPYLESPPAGTLVASHNGRLFVAGLTDAIDAFRYSNLLDPDGWPGNNIIRVKDGANQGITAMRPLGRLLVLYKPRSIHVGTVASQQDAQIRTAVDGIGCVAHSTVVDAGGVHIFLADSGVHSFDGQSTTLLSADLERTFRDLRPVASLARAVWYARRRQYWIWFPSSSVGGGITGDLVLVWHARTGEWTRYEFAGGNMALGILSAHLHSDGEEFLLGAVRFGSAVTGQELVYHARFDVGDRDYDIQASAGASSRTAITHRWVSAPITLAERGFKRWKALRPVMQSMWEGFWTLFWRMDGEPRADAEDNFQTAALDAFGDRHEQPRSLFGTALWGADRWTEREPFVDRIPLAGGVGRTITVGMEKTAMQGHLDVAAFDLDVDPAGSL